MPCEELVERGFTDELAAVVDGDLHLERADRRHVERCLRCQAELAQHRKLLRAMQALRASGAEPPSGLLADVLAHVEATGELSAIRAALTGRKVAYLGGIAAATAAAGAGAAIVLATRGRKGRLPLAG